MRSPKRAKKIIKALNGNERNIHREIWRRANGDVVQRMLYMDCHTWLVDNLLERGDRMSMAASVESRPPFLDHNLVELAFKLPSKFKVKHGSVKWIIKEISKNFLPLEIINRKKIGFRVPLDLWFRGRLRDLAYDLLLSNNSFVANRMSRKSIKSILESHEKSRRDEEIRIWTLLCLEIWYQVFFKSKVYIANYTPSLKI